MTLITSRQIYIHVNLMMLMCFIIIMKIIRHIIISICRANPKSMPGIAAYGPATTAAPPAPNPKADIVLAEDLSSLTLHYF